MRPFPKRFPGQQFETSANMVNSPPRSVEGMRPFWILLVALPLLAGCTAEPAPATEPEAAPSDPASAEAVAQAFSGSGSTSQLPALRFTAGDYNSTVAFSGDFPNPNTCIIDYCAEQTLTFDLTPQVPADAPVDITATFQSDTCLDARLVIEDGDSSRQVSGNSIDADELGVRIVRSPAGVVTLSLRNCSTFAGDLAATSTPVTAEVRTAVRPTVLPTYVPVALELKPGDRLSAMGSDLDDFIVVPPGGAPVHLLGPFEFNVSAEGPSGTYVAVALGDGEAMLHGTPAGMQALPLRWASGEPRPIPSGQELTWDFEVPGVPLWIYVNLETHYEQGSTTSASALGDHEVVVTQQGAEVLRADQSGCVIPCALSLPTGYQYWNYWSGYLPESFTSGPMTVAITNTMAQGFDAYESYAYVQP